MSWFDWLIIIHPCFLRISCFSSSSSKLILLFLVLAMKFSNSVTSTLSSWVIDLILGKFSISFIGMSHKKNHTFGLILGVLLDEVVLQIIFIWKIVVYLRPNRWVLFILHVHNHWGNLQKLLSLLQFLQVLFKGFFLFVTLFLLRNLFPFFKTQ